MQANANSSSIKNGAIGMFNFYNNVKPGGPWDYKSQPGQYNSQTHTAFFFDGRMVRSDFPGNANYGYTGISTNWGTSNLLLGAAGGVQILSNATRGSFSSLSNAPYFDNPGDSAQITQGMQLYQSGR